MRAYVIDEESDFTRGVCEIPSPELESDDVLVEVDFSGVNFKDTMVAAPQSRVRRTPRLVGGVDAVGRVLESNSPDITPGDHVIVHGGPMGVSRDGGFSELLAAPRRYLSLLPPGLSPRDAMIVGTAGFTSMMSILALEQRGLTPRGRVLVTGATGGVGSLAVIFLAARGYHVVASTGSPTHTPWLTSIGASEVVGRQEIADRPERVLASEAWDGAIDCVGGSTLAHILRSLRYGAGVAASGLVASPELATTVYPFITRGIALLGIDSVEAPLDVRDGVWSAIATLGSIVNFEDLCEREVGLDDLDGALDEVLTGATRGRIVVATR